MSEAWEHKKEGSVTKSFMYIFGVFQGILEKVGDTTYWYRVRIIRVQLSEEDT